MTWATHAYNLATVTAKRHRLVHIEVSLQFTALSPGDARHAIE